MGIIKTVLVHMRSVKKEKEIEEAIRLKDATKLAKLAIESMQEILDATLKKNEKEIFNNILSKNGDKEIWGRLFKVWQRGMNREGFASLSNAMDEVDREVHEMIMQEVLKKGK